MLGQDFSVHLSNNQVILAPKHCSPLYTREYSISQNVRRNFYVYTFLLTFKYRMGRDFWLFKATESLCDGFDYRSHIRHLESQYLTTEQKKQKICIVYPILLSPYRPPLLAPPKCLG